VNGEGGPITFVLARAMAAATSARVALPGAHRLRATARGCVRSSRFSRFFAPSSSSRALLDSVIPSAPRVTRSPPPHTPRADASSSPLTRHRPRRAAPRRAAVAASPATSPLSSLPADAPSDPLAALAGVAVTRASDGARVSDLAELVARRAAATPSRATVVVFMRSFG